MSTFQVFDIAGKTYIVTDDPEVKFDTAWGIPIPDDPNIIIINGKRSDARKIDGHQMVPIEIIKNIINSNKNSDDGLNPIDVQTFMMKDIASMVEMDDDSKMYDEIYVDEYQKREHAPPHTDKVMTLLKIENGNIVSNSNKPCFERCKFDAQVKNLCQIGNTEKLRKTLACNECFRSDAIKKCIQFQNYNCLKALSTSTRWRECLNTFIKECPFDISELDDLEKHLLLNNFVMDPLHLFCNAKWCCECKKSSQKDDRCDNCAVQHKNYEYLFANGYITYQDWKDVVSSFSAFHEVVQVMVKFHKYFKEDLSKHALKCKNSFVLEELRKVGYPIKGEEVKESTTEKVAEPSIKKQLNDIRRQIQSLMAKIG